MTRFPGAAQTPTFLQPALLTCYGKTEWRSGGRAAEFEAVHHNPRQLDFADGRLTGMRDHTDEEPRRLEAYVGRTPLFDRVEYRAEMVPDPPGPA